MVITAFVNGPVHSFDPVAREWLQNDVLVMENGIVRSLALRDVGANVQTIDLAGRALVPAFADCHVHLTDTGLKGGDRNFGDVRDAATFERRVAALPKTRFVIAGAYDDAQWTDGAIASAAPLDAHHRDAIALVIRVDAHSSLVSRGALAFLDFPPEMPGVECDADGVPTGRLFLEANWRAQARIFAALPEVEKRAADARAAALALREGAVHLHVQLVGLGDTDAYRAEIAAMRGAGPAKWHPKICERDASIAHALGLAYTGGDVFLDGSIGSRTAAVSEPFCGVSGGIGTLMHADAEVETYFAQAHALGMSAGVHAIGDRAIEQCLAAWERVLPNGPGSARHFIEHFEIARPDQIERAARLGIYLSMQPQFDALWGAPGGMYEERLGIERARGMNRLKSALRAGAVLVGGDDSPVCALSPLRGMRAATEHFNSAEQLTIEEAMSMYTYDAARFGHVEHHTGTLGVGSAADLVILDGDPFATRSFAEISVLETWVDGACVHAA